MRVLKYISKIDNITVKSILRSHFKMSSSVISALKNTDGIKVNGAVVTVRKILYVDDILELIIPESHTSNIVPVEGKLDVLYEDKDILCVNKPSGIPTHPSQNHYHDTLANVVCDYYKDVPFTFRVCNRLDSYTSGIVIVSKNMYSASLMCTEPFRRSINKEYYAYCRGIFSNKTGIVEAPISRSSGSTIKREVSPNGKYALTEYEVVFDDEYGNSIVHLRPKTGRTHQIRVHMAYLGHPLVDDFLYDECYSPGNKFKLHCAKMEFIHPVTDKKISINSEPVFVSVRK